MTLMTVSSSAPALYPGEEIIHAGNYRKVLDPEAKVDGEHKARGLIPRSYASHPPGYYEFAPVWGLDMPLIPRGEWPERIADQLANKARLSDVRMTGNSGSRIPSRDQNGKGYCWAHSTTSAVLICRAVMNEPYVDLSAYAVACVIKSYRDEGGWGAQSAEFITERGIPSSKFWPQKSMSKSNDNAATWENAALHKITASWVDMNAAQYDRKLTFDQYVTLWLSGEPGVCDFNWWGHSVCGIDVVNGNATFGTCRGESGKLLSFEDFNLVWGVNTEAGGFGTRIWNSWGDSWSEGGTGVLTGSHAIPDGGLGIRGVRPSVS